MLNYSPKMEGKTAKTVGFKVIMSTRAPPPPPSFPLIIHLCPHYKQKGGLEHVRQEFVAPASFQETERCFSMENGSSSFCCCRLKQKRFCKRERWRFCCGLVCLWPDSDSVKQVGTGHWVQKDPSSRRGQTFSGDFKGIHVFTRYFTCFHKTFNI